MPQKLELAQELVTMLHMSHMHCLASDRLR
jgi:hypothetical protein